jgi:hypothetical protein
MAVYAQLRPVNTTPKEHDVVTPNVIYLGPAYPQQHDPLPGAGESLAGDECRSVNATRPTFRDQASMLTGASPGISRAFLISRRGDSNPGPLHYE